MTTAGEPRWPHRELDPDAVRPVPLRQFVLKVHSRCNLACDYCYIYRGQDASWRERPARVPEATVRRTARRIAEHAAAHRLTALRIDLHGGEPLLGGAGPVLAYAAEVRRAVREAVRGVVPGGCEVTATVQTNGTLLTPRTLDRLAAGRVRVGLSLDGGAARLNTRRTDRRGRSSWPAVAEAARLLARRPGAYAGILCTVDLATDPADVYRSLLALGPPGIDLLLPHGNWAAPPPGIAPAPVPGRRPRPTPYGDWLVRVFDLWWDDDRMRTGVRLFQEIVALLLGVPSTVESVGLSPMVAVVVDTDGAIEQTGALRSAYEGASATGLDVFRHSFDRALRHPGLAARQLGAAGLSHDCAVCPVREVCGGGNYAHRYAPYSGFLHPSVYCADLERLIRHIAARLADADARRRGGP